MASKCIKEPAVSPKKSTTVTLEGEEESEDKEEEEEQTHCSYMNTSFFASTHSIYLKN